MSYDSFYTQKYKSGWVHTKRDIASSKTIVHVTFSDHTNQPARSVQAAKNAITRFERRLTTDRHTS